jgi:xylulose-5-phosphate/fructose-6-phosphate phosphoketolase
MAQTMDHMIERIRAIQADARKHGFSQRPRWPMLVLCTPKGWTGPAEVDDLPVANNWRSHQVPLSQLA